MSVLHAPPASSSDSQNSGTEYRPLTLRLADIAATLTMAASRIRASISQYQSEAANTDDPSAARIMHFKAGLQWEITYSAARNIISVIPNRSLIFFSCFPSSPGTLFQINCLFIPPMIISSYDTPWWIGHTAIPNKLWQWDRVFACCIRHYQHWLVDETSVQTLLALKWMRERLRTLVEEQQEGIHEKMGEIEVYTAILTRLKRGRGE
ncbi:hypothetical protein EDB19DRAFT_1832539 [Suillus lakei]|nr:hypothetical protein EDB19DRAFT_1832539 [Suillus lakei]